MDCSLLEVQPAAWQQCSCCWHTCQAAIADSCLGLTHWRFAPSNMHGAQPVYDNSPFFLMRLYRNLLNSNATLQLVFGRPHHVWTSRQSACQEVTSFSYLWDGSFVLDIRCQFNSYWNRKLQFTYLHLGCLDSALNDCMTLGACQAF